MPEPAAAPARPSLLHRFAPGILVAATGVGAGDLITASLAGANVGLVVLWAAWVGALLKWSLNEGLARWQLATGLTLLEGWHQQFGRVAMLVFLVYLLLWSVVVAGALVTACGIAATSIFPLSENLEQSMKLWGILHAVLGLLLVWIGGFKVFERVMGATIALMFVTVVVTTLMLRPDPGPIVANLFIPSIPSTPDTPGKGLGYLLGVIGGVGGTLTLLSYGYWIREVNRSGKTGLQQSQIDLAIGYTLTGLFGLCMVIIGSQLELTGSGAVLSRDIATQIATAIGPAGKWLFLIGFWGAVFSSLLGVWQSVPYIFADFSRITVQSMSLVAVKPQGARATIRADITRGLAYRGFLVGLTLAGIVVVSLKLRVEAIQLAYAVSGALFMPVLAGSLLWMNSRLQGPQRAFRTPWAIRALLVLTLLFFLWAGVDVLRKQLAPAEPASDVAATTAQVDSADAIETAAGMDARPDDGRETSTKSRN